MRRALAEIQRQNRAAEEAVDSTEDSPSEPPARVDWIDEDWSTVMPPWALRWKRMTSLTLLTIRTAGTMNLMQQVQGHREAAYQTQLAAVELWQNLSEPVS